MSGFFYHLFLILIVTSVIKDIWLLKIQRIIFNQLEIKKNFNLNKKINYFKDYLYTYKHLNLIKYDKLFILLYFLSQTFYQIYSRLHKLYLIFILFHILIYYVQICDILVLIPDIYLILIYNQYSCLYNYQIFQMVHNMLSIYQYFILLATKFI